VSGANGETRRQFYQNHIETWKKSKKSMASYGKESGLSYHAFQYWLRVSRIDTRALVVYNKLCKFDRRQKGAYTPVFRKIYK